MSLSNEQIKKLIKSKNVELEEAINNIEANLLTEEEEDKGRALFWLGRAQSIYAEFQALLKNQKVL